MSWHDEPDTIAMMRRIDEAFTALRKAENTYGRVKRPEAKEAARLAVEKADAVYRQISNERDEFVEIRKAQRAQGKVSPIKLTPKLFPGAPERDE